MNEKDAPHTAVFFLGVAFVAGIVYLATLCPTVEFIDSGELAANSWLLGIPHPTGYPFYVLLARLATILLPGEIIFRCNLLSLIFTAFSAGLLFLLVAEILPRSTLRLPVASATALFAAFAPVWWSQGTSNEVYCVTLLADLLAILLFIKYRRRKEPKLLVAGFYIWGLSFGSHLGTVFLLPAIVYLSLATDKLKGILQRRYLVAAIFFALALSLYLYLPIRAAHRPFLNWGNPATFHGLINHISGWQYRVWMFKSLEQMTRGLDYFAGFLYRQLGVAGLIVMGIGTVSMFWKESRLAIFLAVIVLADVLYSANYEIIDIDSYYLVGIAVLAIFVAHGAWTVTQAMVNRLKAAPLRATVSATLIAALFGLPFSSIMLNYHQQHKREKYVARAGVDNILASMETGGISLTQNWDYYSPWLYYRYVLDVRPDVVMIDKELLRRSWYIDFLRRYHPDVMAGSKQPIDHFLNLLAPFEHDESYDSRALNAAFQQMIASIVTTNVVSRPVYTNILQDPDLVIPLARVPVGVLYKFEPDFHYVPFDIGKLDFSAWEKPSLYIDARTRVALGSLYQAIRFREGYCRQLGYPEEAAQYAGLSQRLERILGP